MNSQIPSVASSAACVTPSASAAPRKALASPTAARASPPGSRRSTEVMTCTTSKPATTGTVTAPITATFARNQSAPRSTWVPVSSAASAVGRPTPRRRRTRRRARRGRSRNPTWVAPPTTPPAASHSGSSGPSTAGFAGRRHWIRAPIAEKNAMIPFAPPISSAPPAATSTPVLPLEACM